MNVRERYLATYRHEPTDRVPVVLSYFHADFRRQHLDTLAPGENPIEASIRHQLRYGFDPHVYVRGTGRDWFLAQPDHGCETPAYGAASADWQVREEVSRDAGGTIRTAYTVETPGGVLSCRRLQTPDDFGVFEAPFIRREEDIDLLRFRPHPQYVISHDRIRQDHETMGDRCWSMASVASPWTCASFFRGPDTIMLDLYDRPEWVKRFLGLLADYQVELVKEIGRAGVDVTIRMDNSFLGFGLSRRMFTEFIQPNDQRVVQAAHDAGLRVHVHICGKKNAFLQDLADMGIDALETLTPKSAAGDVDLADAKRRIGDRVCLMGGFLSHVLTFGTPEQIEEEVKACLVQAAHGGGYMLSPTGRIDPETPEANLYAFTEAGRRYGALGVR